MIEEDELRQNQVKDLIPKLPFLILVLVLIAMLLKRRVSRKLASLAG